nr:OIG1-like protein [Parasacculina yatsui]
MLPKAQNERRFLVDTDDQSKKERVIQSKRLKSASLLISSILLLSAVTLSAAVNRTGEVNRRKSGGYSSFANSSRSASVRLHLPGRDLWRKSSVWRLLPSQKHYPQYMNEFTILGRTPPGAVTHGAKSHRRRASSKARVVKSSHYQLKYTLGRKIVFICVATGYPRPQITWFKDGIEMYNHNFFKVHEWEVGHRMIKSKMEIDPATPMDVGYYECVADNFHSVDIQGFRTEYKASNYLDPSQRG